MTIDNQRRKKIDKKIVTQLPVEMLEMWRAGEVSNIWMLGRNGWVYVPLSDKNLKEDK